MQKCNRFSCLLTYLSPWLTLSETILLLEVMAEFNSTATATMRINGREAHEELNRLKAHAKDLEDAIVKASNAGNKADLSKWKRELKKTRKEIQLCESATTGVENVMRRLDRATPKELNRTLSTLKRQLNDIERGSAAWNAQVQKIKAVKAELSSVNGEMREHQSLAERAMAGLDKWGMAIAGAMGAVAGVVMAGKKAVNAYAEMEQEEANVRKFTGMTAEQVGALNEEFKKMDTRSSREQLNQLAQEAGRLGKSSQEDVLGFVRAADKINVALDDLGEGATLTLSKLAGIFGDEDRLGTEKALLSIGSVINELSQNCAASAPYLAQFASRMGGVAAQAGMTSQQVMAFGAVLDSNNQALEASSTAVSQVIMRIYQDPAKYAKVAGMDVAKFTQQVKTDMNGALISLLETLNQAGSMDVLSPMFKDMGENGARAVAALSTLAGHINEVKDQQIVANQAFREATSIDKEYAVQNETAQAKLDKARKGFNELAVTLGEKLMPVMRYAISGTSAMMRAMLGVIRFVGENQVAILTVCSAIVAYHIAVRAATVETTLFTAAQKVNAVFNKIYAVTMSALSVLYYKFTGNVQKATAAQRLFNASIRLNPMGLLIAAVTAAIVVIGGLIKRMVDADKKQEQLRRDMERYKNSIRDISQATSQYAAEETKKLETLYKASQNHNLSMKERIAKVKELQKTYPSYFGKMTTEAILAGNAAKKYQELTEAIINAAKARAAADKIKENFKTIIELETANEQLKRNENQKTSKLKKSKARKAEARADQKYRKNTSGVMGGIVAEGLNVGGAFSTENDVLSDDVADRVEEALSSEISTLKTKQAGNKAKIKLLQESNNWLKKTYGVKDEQLVDQQPNVQPNINMPGNNAYGGGTSGGGNNTGHNTDNEQADKFAKVKAWKEKEEATNRIAYATGLKDYEQYTTDMERIEVEYNQRALDTVELTAQERLNLQAALAEAEKKLADETHGQNREQLEQQYAQQQADLKQAYIDGLLSLQAYNEATERAELSHMRVMRKFEKEGSKERLDIEKKYRDKLFEAQKKKHQDAKAQEEAHQKEMKAVWEKYAVPEREKNKEEYKRLLAMLIEVYETAKQALEAQGKDTSELDGQFQMAVRKLKGEFEEKGKKDEDESPMSFIELFKAEIVKAVNADSWNPKQKKGLIDTIDNVVSYATSAYQSLTQMMQLESEIQIATISKRYDAEISMAEGNTYKVNRLEKKKQQEVQRIKDKATKRQMAVQVAQALATTAEGAINGYTSAMKLPFPANVITAPLVAAMAIAAGMMQVATIKKQQQAATAQGYAEGGFTPKGPKDKEVGVVHAGEWVASQKLVQNAQARPLIDALEYAQRHNTMPTLQQADVSRSVTAPNVIAMNSGNNEGMAAVASALSQYAGTMKSLNERLDEPFTTVNTVTGDAGMKKAQEEYQQLMNNTKPKSQRK